MSNLKPNQFLLAGILITERPILFQTEMVKANMEDRKTQTRRGFNQPSYLTNSNQQFKRMGFVNGNPQKYAAAIGGENFSTLFESKYGKPGDLLWVRETWLKYDRDHVIQNLFAYKANADKETEEVRKVYVKLGRKYQWKPSIHMPKLAARIWLMVEEIRVERVQNISESDSIAEGCKQYDEKTEWLTAKSGFEELWKSINGSESWDQNPWVWVIKYRILSKTGRPSDDLILQNYQEVTNLKSTL